MSIEAVTRILLLTPITVITVALIAPRNTPPHKPCHKDRAEERPKDGERARGVTHPAASKL